MKIQVSNEITVIDPVPAVEEYCAAKLKIPNPLYAKAKARAQGRYIGYIPKQISFYRRAGTNLILPVGCFSELYSRFPSAQWVSGFANPEKVQIHSAIKLRDYQECAVQAALKRKNGVLVMFAGSGKTQTALEILARIGLPALWLTHTRDLLTQAKQRAVQCLPGLKTGEISEGACTLGEQITFATVQTLVNRLEDIPKDTFGAIVVDECHRVCVSPDSVGQFQQCLSCFSARYKLGLTATPHRADGLVQGMFAVLGPVIYEMRRNQATGYFDCRAGKEVLCRVPVEQFQVPAKVIQIPTDYTIDGKEELFDQDGGTVQYARLISDLCADSERNRLILEWLLREAGQGLAHSCLILSDRVEQLRTLERKAQQLGMTKTAVLCAASKKEERETAIEKMRSGGLTLLFASYKLAKEGLDIPRLDRLFLASPVKDRAVVEQSVGRVQRPFPHKTEAVVYDFCDATGLLIKMCKDRARVYRQCGMEIVK